VKNPTIHEMSKHGADYTWQNWDEG